MKKSYLFNSILWVIISFFVSFLYKYYKVKTTGSGNYSWGSSISVWVGGAIIGLVTGIVFVIVDYLLLNNRIKNKRVLLIIRFAMLVTILLITSSVID